MKFAASEATKITAHATSSGRASRCSGTSREACAIIAGVFQTSSTPSVSVGPGATALTVIPDLARPAPSHHVRAVTPALEAAHGAMPRRPARHGTEVTFTILP